MRILLIGFNSTFGGVIRRELGSRHSIVDASRTRGVVNVDKPGGSFTLTSGSTAQSRVPGFANTSALNAGWTGFVVRAAIEMRRSQRINVVSPGLLEESVEHYSSFFPGHVPVAGAGVARAYAKSVGGGITGQTTNV